RRVFWTEARVNVQAMNQDREGDLAYFVGQTKLRRLDGKGEGMRAVFFRRDAGLSACIPSLRDQRIDVPLLQRGVEQPAVEIAVVADGRTERNVDVQPEHGNLVIG